jgi:superfamily I DNA/RNA helicase
MIGKTDNDLFFVGDGHQRIYSRHKAAMSRCGIDIRGRARKLYLNYRTTDEIRRHAVALLEGIEVDDLDDGSDEVRRYKSLSHGPEPIVMNVQGLEQASEQVIKLINQWGSSVPSEAGGGSVAVVAGSERVRDAVGVQLEAAGLKTVLITAQANHSQKRGVVHLSTMHRAKGLEFDCVIVISPALYLSREEQQQSKRNLLYVALTRAKKLAALLILN